MVSGGTIFILFLGLNQEHKKISPPKPEYVTLERVIAKSKFLIQSVYAREVTQISSVSKVYGVTFLGKEC